MSIEFSCEVCGMRFDGTAGLLEHKFAEHYYPRAFGQPETAIDTRDRNPISPVYGVRVLSKKSDNQVLWIERIEALEQRIAALEAENERLKAGK